MKKYKLIAAFAASMTFMTGCYDLDVYPEDQLSSGTFFKTQAHADQAMMGVYSLMTDDNVFGVQFGFDCLGGVGSGFGAGGYGSIAMGTYDGTTNFVTNKFRKLYEGIARTNIVLQNIEGCGMTEDLVKRYKAEAKFMRALYYFTLTDFWGGVPYYDETTVVATDFMSMLKGKEPLEKVRSYIIADLDEAIAGLPIEWDNTNKGRATSGAALALKGKVLLYDKKYDEAKACFEEVIGETPDSKYKGVYALYPKYEDLFKPEGDSSNEMIFAIQNIGGVGQDFGMPLNFYMGTRSSYGSCWNNALPSVSFVDSYEWKDGTKFDWTEPKPEYGWEGFPDYNKLENKKYPVREKIFYSVLTDDKKKVEKYPEYLEELTNMYKNRDPRMMVSIILPYTKYDGWVNNKALECEYVLTEKPGQTLAVNGFVQTTQNREYYLWRKFVSEGNMNGAINKREDTPINFPLIRLADVYLMLAECYIESTSNQDLVKACGYISKVRERAGMPSVSASTKDEAFEILRHERAVELAAEGHSFSDMKRWRLLETLNGRVRGIVKESASGDYNRVVIERDYLWPFPLTECDMNPALKEGQNEGW